VLVEALFLFIEKALGARRERQEVKKASGGDLLRYHLHFVSGSKKASEAKGREASGRQNKS